MLYKRSIVDFIEHFSGIFKLMGNNGKYFMVLIEAAQFFHSKGPWRFYAVLVLYNKRENKKNGKKETQ